MLLLLQRLLLLVPDVPHLPVTPPHLRHGRLIAGYDLRCVGEPTVWLLLPFAPLRSHGWLPTVTVPGYDLTLRVDL